MASWFWMKDGQKHGPIDTPQLKQMAQAGQIKPTDLIWREGLPDWVPASKAKGLFGAEAAPAGGGDVSSPAASRPSASPAVAASAEQPAAPGRKAKRKLIIGGAILAVLIAAGIACFVIWKSGDDKDAIIAKRALAVSTSSMGPVFRANSPDDCMLLLDLHKLIQHDDYDNIPNDKVYITYSGQREDPSWSATGTVTTSDETKNFVKACFVVPKDVRTFTLHLGDRKPIEFTAPKEIEDEISSDD